MGSSHGVGAVDAAVARVGANRADISGMAMGESSDALNDRLGRPREGAVQEVSRLPHFVTMRMAGVDPNARVLGSPLHTQSLQYKASSTFEPVLADQSTVPFGWLPDVKGEWHRVDRVCRLVLNGGRVDAVFADGVSATLANYGVDVAEAGRFRARVAVYVSEVVG